jgi:hypothetical protein
MFPTDKTKEAELDESLAYHKSNPVNLLATDRIRTDLGIFHDFLYEFRNGTVEPDPAALEKLKLLAMEYREPRLPQEKLETAVKGGWIKRPNGMGMVNYFGGLDNTINEFNTYLTHKDGLKAARNAAKEAVFQKEVGAASLGLGGGGRRRRRRTKRRKSSKKRKSKRRKSSKKRSRRRRR